MIKLIDILKEITEGKQVGTLYHFTPIENLSYILKDGYLIPNFENQVSTTRNKNVDPTSFSDNYSETANMARLKLNGDKISNNYKIRPYLYDEDEVPEDRSPAYISKYEFEEQIITNGKNLPIFPYLEQVDIFMEDDNDDNISEIESLLKEKNIPYEIK
jgi:hypothetical protein